MKQVAAGKTAETAALLPGNLSMAARGLAVTPVSLHRTHRVELWTDGDLFDAHVFEPKVAAIGQL